MTKKHFEAIAKLISSEVASGRKYEHSALYCLKRMAFGMADLFAQENPRFDKIRFLKASGLEVES